MKNQVVLPSYSHDSYDNFRRDVNMSNHNDNNSPLKSSILLEKHILFINITYILTIGVSGLVLCALGSNLNDISNRIGMNATELGGFLYLFRGIGCILGAMISSTIYYYFKKGDSVLLVGLLVIACMLMLIPFSASSTQLYIYFFILGLCSAINDTGCTILTRKLRGRQAGPWLACNGISFGLSAALVPLVECLSNQFTIQYYLLATLICIVAYLVYTGMYSNYSESEVFNYTYKIPSLQGTDIDEKGHNYDLENSPRTAYITYNNRSTDSNSSSNSNKDITQPIHYNVELLMGFVVFCLVGGQVDTVGYYTCCILILHSIYF